MDQILINFLVSTAYIVGSVLVAVVAVSILGIFLASRAGKLAREQDQWASGALLLDSIEKGKDVSRL